MRVGSSSRPAAVVDISLIQPTIDSEPLATRDQRCIWIGYNAGRDDIRELSTPRSQTMAHCLDDGQPCACRLWRNFGGSVAIFVRQLRYRSVTKPDIQWQVVAIPWTAVPRGLVQQLIDPTSLPICTGRPEIALTSGSQNPPFNGSLSYLRGQRLFACTAQMIRRIQARGTRTERSWVVRRQKLTSLKLR